MPEIQEKGQVKKLLEKTSFKEKFFNLIKKPPYYSFIFLLVAVIFSILTIIVSGFSFNITLFTIIGITFLGVFIYWVIELLLKQKTFGVDILNALFFCLILATLVIGIDASINQKKNLGTSYISLEREQKQTFEETQEISTATNESILLDISKKTGTLLLENVERDDILTYSEYFFKDEALEFKVVEGSSQTTVNLRINPRSLSLSRIIRGSNNNYKLQLPSSLKKIDLKLQSQGGKNTINLQNSILDLQDVFLSSSDTSFNLQGTEIINTSVFDIQNSEVSIKNPIQCQNDIETSLENSELIIDLSETEIVGDLDFTLSLKKSNLIIKVNEEVGIKVNYENFGNLNVLDNDLQDRKGVYTSTNFEKSLNSITLNLKIDSQSAVEINDNV